jgi:hypothetical protein
MKMKRLLSLLLIQLLLSCIFVGCSQLTTKVSTGSKPQIIETPNNTTTKYKLAIYLVKDLTAFDAAKTDLVKLPLENEPIVTEKDISAYYWKSNVIKTSMPVFKDKLSKVAKLSGTPYVLTANGERIYLGILWTPLSSMVPPEETPVLNLLGSALIMENLNKDGYNVIQDDNDIHLEISAPYKGKDNRNDKRIYNALKDAGVLKE